jgi:hypothetical protein
MNLFNRMTHQMDHEDVEVGIKLLGNINTMAGTILPGINLVLLVGCHSSLSICVLVYLFLLQEFQSRPVGFGCLLVASLPKEENFFDGVKLTKGDLHVAQCSIVVRFTSRINIRIY